MPLLNAFLLGSISILAGLSFFLPNRMGVIYKAPIAILCICLGALYIYISAFSPSETDKASMIRMLLASLVLCILVSNVGSFVVERLKFTAAKKAGLHRRRRDDIH